MYHNLTIPKECQNLWQTCHSLVPELLVNCKIKTADLKISSNQPIDPHSKSLYLIKSGIISEKLNGQLIVNYENGDLIGLDGILHWIGRFV